MARGVPHYVPFAASQLSAPTSDAELIAQGFQLVPDSQGRRLWTRSLTSASRTTSGPGSSSSVALSGDCTAGQCGSQFQTVIRPRLSDGNPQPRGRGQAPAAPRVPNPPTQAPIADTPPPQSIDLDKLASLLVDKLASDNRFKGPKGEPGEAGSPGMSGPPGSPGAAGPPGRDGQAASVDYDQIIAAVINRIDYDAIAERVIVKTPANQSEVHYTVVADDTASYWQRVEASLRRARERYHGLTDARPPENYTGQLPVIVKYTNGVPEYIARGESQVTTALSLLAQGQTP